MEHNIRTFLSWNYSYRTHFTSGYKIRWRKKGNRKSDILTTDGSRRLFAITGLKRGVSYQVKISALTVNGTGPATQWLEEATFLTDLDETVVPSPPSSLRAKATDDAIAITWTPPRDQSRYFEATLVNLISAYNFKSYVVLMNFHRR